MHDISVHASSFIQFNFQFNLCLIKKSNFLYFNGTGKIITTVMSNLYIGIIKHTSFTQLWPGNTQIKWGLDIKLVTVNVNCVELC